MNSNNDSNYQPISADSSISNAPKNGNSGSAIALPKKAINEDWQSLNPPEDKPINLGSIKSFHQTTEYLSCIHCGDQEGKCKYKFENNLQYSLCASVNSKEEGQKIENNSIYKLKAFYKKEKACVFSKSFQEAIPEGYLPTGYKDPEFKLTEKEVATDISKNPKLELLETPITGIEATKIFLKNLKYQIGDHFILCPFVRKKWAKDEKNNHPLGKPVKEFWRATLVEGFEPEEILIRVQKFKKHNKLDENGKKIRDLESKYPNAYLKIRDEFNNDIHFPVPGAISYLEDLIPLFRDNPHFDTGLTSIPNKMFLDGETFTVTSNKFKAANSIFFEVDTSPNFDDNFNHIKTVCAWTGVTPTMVVSSGNKSPQCYFCLKEGEVILDEKIRLELQRRLVILYSSDPKVNNSTRELRTPGFYRAEKGKEQTIVALNDRRYTVRELFEITDKFFPHGLTDIHWKEYLEIRKAFSQKDQGGLLKTALSMCQVPEEKIKPKTPIRIKPDSKIRDLVRSAERSDTKINSSLIAPFEIFLGKQRVDLINRGLPAGDLGRDPMAHELSLDFQGRQLILDRLGIPYTDAYSLVQKFCNNCTPPIPESAPKVWVSAAKKVKEHPNFDDYFFLFRYSQWLKETAPDEHQRIFSEVDIENPNNPEEQELKESQQQAWKEQRGKEHKERYLESKKLTPIVTTNTEFFNFLRRELPKQLSLLEAPPPTQYLTSIPEENLILLGCGDLGGGKTTWMKAMIEAIREACPDERWFALGYINGLLLQQCRAWKKDEIGARRLKHLQSEHAFKDIHKETQDLAFCVHSLKRFEECLSVFDGCNIVIDEVVSVSKALLQDDNIKEGDRDLILRVFGEALRRAKRVFCFDALLSDMTAWYLSQICPEKKIISVKNEYQRPKPKVEFLLGTGELEKQLSSVDNIKKSDNSPICKALLNSKRFVLVSDNRTIIQILGELLKGQGKEVLVICRDTNGEDNVKAFLGCPDTWIKQNWIDKNIDGCVLISPTGGSGIDISVKNYFTDLYGLFFGVIDVDGILQMLGRLRDNEANFHVWVKDRGSIQNVLGNFSKEIHRNVRAYIDHLQTIIWEGYQGNPVADIIAKFSNQLLEKANDIHFKMQCALMSQQLYEEWHLRECAQETLISRGYQLNFVTLDSAEGTKKAIKDKREEFHKQQSQNIFDAEDLTEEQVIEISSNFFQTPEQKNALKKFSLRSRLPGIENTELWNPEFIQSVVFDNPLYLSQLEMLYLLRNPEVAKLKAQTRWAAALERESLRHFDILHERYARVKALQNINIEYFINPDNLWDNDSPELIASAKEAKKPHNKVALPKAPGKDLVKWINNVLATLTYAPEKSRIHSDQRKYKITPKEEEEKTKIILLECLGKQEKYKDLPQKQKSHIFGSKIAPNPCPERTKTGSTCGKFDLEKTSGKWSQISTDYFQETKSISHVEEQVSGFRTWAGGTEVAATG